MYVAMLMILFGSLLVYKHDGIIFDSLCDAVMTTLYRPAI
jgi:hypothetical protein